MVSTDIDLFYCTLFTYSIPVDSSGISTITPHHTTAALYGPAAGQLDLGWDCLLTKSDGTTVITNKINPSNGDYNFYSAYRDDIVMEDPEGLDERRLDGNGFYVPVDSVRVQNENNRYFSIESCVYLTGNDIAWSSFWGITDLSAYGPVPLVAAWNTYDFNRTDPSVQNTPHIAIKGSPSADVVVYTNGTSPSTITLYPNLQTTQRRSDPQLVTVPETLNVTVWAVKPLNALNPSDDPNNTRIVPANGNLYQEIVNQTITYNQSYDATTGLPTPFDKELNYTINAGTLGNEWAPLVNGKKTVTMVFKVEAKVHFIHIDPSTGNTTKQNNIIDGNSVPMTRTITRIFTVTIEPSVLGAAMPDPPESLNSIKNKLINDICTTIDCSDSWLFCNTLEDC